MNRPAIVTMHINSLRILRVKHINTYKNPSILMKRQNGNGTGQATEYLSNNEYHFWHSFSGHLAAYTHNKQNTRSWQAWISHVAWEKMLLLKGVSSYKFRYLLFRSTEIRREKKMHVFNKFVALHQPPHFHLFCKFRINIITLEPNIR